MLLVLFLSLEASVLTAQTDCATCTIELPTLPEDTIFISSVPDGTTGVYYEGAMSFRMPETTTPVAADDPSVPEGIAIDKITILSVSNLPPGIVWEVEDDEYDIPEEKDGCVSFCGTPLQPGTYMVEVVIDAEVVIISQTASFTFPFTVLPGSSTTEGFSMVNNSGCGEVLVGFENNVISDGMDGFTYSWDFGNGFTSEEENPEEQLYEVPGVYEVNYEAIVDTFGFFMTNILVEDVSCDDLFSRPDLRVEIINPNDSVIFNSGVVNNAETPLDFPINIFIGEGTHIIKVTDDDNGLGGADDLCGEIPFLQTANGPLVDGDLNVNISIFHPVDTIRSVDTVSVFPQPDVPFVAGIPNDAVCEGTPITLSIPDEANIQWYQDSLPVIGAEDVTLDVEASGLYWVLITNEFGCSAQSETFEIAINASPSNPVYTNENNLLTLFPSETLPENYTLKWFLDGNLILGETAETYCIEESGEYTLEITDLLTGCTNTFTQNINFDPDFEGCLTDTEELNSLLSWNVYPNPITDNLWVKINTPLLSAIYFTISNAEGKVLYQQNYRQLSQGTVIEMPVQDFPAGVYWITFQTAEVKDTKKLIKF